jgi:hypothetical protein
MGSTVAHGWRVAELSGAAAGSCVLTLQNERGRTHRIHLCRNNGQPHGLVYTRRFDLLVMNGVRATGRPKKGSRKRSRRWRMWSPPTNAIRATRRSSRR